MIERRVVLRARPERVWEALTDPGQVAAWMGGLVEWTVEEGGGLRFVGDAGEVREGRVEQVEPARTLRFRWWDTADGDRSPSEVVYALEPDEDGTVLTVTEMVVPAGAAAGTAFPTRAGLGRPDAWGPLDQLALALESAAWGPAHAGAAPTAGPALVVG